ncbi:MAG: ABC transporter permease subunit, partial [Ruminococcus sp.]|nr:ABC transporter permease subunit [Ruminococcus sp.]
INMIKADLYRITKNVVFYIAIGLVLLMLGVSIYVVQPGVMGQMSVGDISTIEYMQDATIDDMSMQEMSELSVKDLREMVLNTEGYELDKNVLAANMNLYYVFIFIAVLVITVDFSAGSVKNTLSSAINKNRYFLSKTLFVFGMCIFIFFMNTYVCYFGNLVFNYGKVSSDLWTVTKISLLQLPPMLAIMSILIGIAFTLRKTSVFNIIAIPLVMVFQLVMSLVITLFNLDSKISEFEFQIMIGKLTSEPPMDYITKSYIYCALLIIAFLSLGYTSFRKSEIK